MSRSRLAPDSLDAQYLLFLLHLSVATAINEFKYLPWLMANRDELQEEFCATDEPEDEFGVWARLKFRESVTA